MDIRDIVNKLRTTKDYAATMWRIGRALGAIVIGICMILAMSKLDEQYNNLNVKADAEIIKVEDIFIEVEYEYDDVTYSCKTFKEPDTKYHEGDVVKVKFDDDEPEVAVLTGAKQYNTFSILAKIFLGIGLLFIVVGVIKIIPQIKYLVGMLSDLSKNNPADDDFDYEGS